MWGFCLVGDAVSSCHAADVSSPLHPHTADYQQGTLKRFIGTVVFLAEVLTQ